METSVSSKSALSELDALIEFINKSSCPDKVQEFNRLLALRSVYGNLPPEVLAKMKA